jgi:hypothetical protein
VKIHTILIIRPLNILVASKEIGLKMNAEKTKYMIMSGKQNAGQIYIIKVSNKSFEGLERFKYSGTTINKAKFHS